MHMTAITASRTKNTATKTLVRLTPPLPDCASGADVTGDGVGATDDDVGVTGCDVGVTGDDVGETVDGDGVVRNDVGVGNVAADDDCVDCLVNTSENII